MNVVDKKANWKALHKIRQQIEKSVQAELDKMGIQYKIISRLKSKESLITKIKSKNEIQPDYYSINGKKIQDLIGIKVLTYFADDVNICVQFFKSKCITESSSVDDVTPYTFKPRRNNLVFNMSNEGKEEFQKVLNNLNYIYLMVDTTYEVQFRTALSDGWHEIEHFLRYKNKNDWEPFPNEDRMLNGILGAIESHDMSLNALFNELSHKHYMNKKWETMMRMKYRLTFSNESMDTNIINLLNEEHELAKVIYEYNRTKFINGLAQEKYYIKGKKGKKEKIQITFNNVACIIIKLAHREGNKLANLSQNANNLINSFISTIEFKEEI
ncbi:MAG: hypothetical protein LBL74_06870 [Bacteroidales bacterium]|jgi:ppGpp synthetase/RelA/SpoT-type nucleotidyltranferase|nr:hypothetical protein [Bacteroidales bacterium]